MIPQTFPSVVDANNRTKMVVYEVPSIVGLTRWIDYIPVKSPPNENDLSLANTFANDGFILSNGLTSVTGLQAFVDYIPIYVDNAATTAWTTDANGYIPLSDLFSPLSLFANGEQGVWYDPSDFTTMFQDSAGTTPVTAVEQPVGRILDKSGRGNHATQSTGTKRPVLSARYNQLVGTTTLATQNVTTVATDYILSFTGAGSITLSGTKIQAGITAGTNTITGVTAGTLTLTVVGNVTNAQLVPLSQSTIPYQQVTTSTNYDTTASNFPPYLRFDGIDDILNLPLVPFTATDNHFIVVGASIINLASTDIYAMTNTGNPSTGGLIKIGYSGGGGFLYALRDNAGGLTLCDGAGTSTAGGRNVLSGRKLGNDHILRVNTQNGTNRNVVIATTTLNVAGVGARPTSTNNTTISNQITGNIYSVIAVRAVVSDTNRLNTEKYVAGKLGVTL